MNFEFELKDRQGKKVKKELEQISLLFIVLPSWFSCSTALDAVFLAPLLGSMLKILDKHFSANFLKNLFVCVRGPFISLLRVSNI